MSEDDKRQPPQQDAPDAKPQPVDEKAQADAAKEREKTGGYQ